MKIENYIAELLYRYPCVTVFGFGAFLAEIQSSQLEKKTNTFSPPKKNISFNTYLKNNDGLLANHIALVEKISFEDALIVIQTAVLNWEKELNEIGFLNLINIGTIKKTANETLLFTPNNNVNFLIESFGLASFTSNTVMRNEVLQLTNTSQKTVNLVDKKEDTISIKEKKEIYLISDELKSINEIENVIPINKKESYLKYVGMLLLALGISGGLFYGIYQNQIEKETLRVQTSVQKKVQLKIQEATFFIKTEVPAVTIALEETTKEEINSEIKMPYHIMAGAFRSEKNAQKALKQLQNIGYKNAKQIPINKSGLYPVIYASYSTLSEAERAKSEIQMSHNPEAWILIESF